MVIPASGYKTDPEVPNCTQPDLGIVEFAIGQVQAGMMVFFCSFGGDQGLGLEDLQHAIAHQLIRRRTAPQDSLPFALPHVSRPNQQYRRRWLSVTTRS